MTIKSSTVSEAIHLCGGSASPAGSQPPASNSGIRHGNDNWPRPVAGPIAPISFQPEISINITVNDKEGHAATTTCTTGQDLDAHKK